jgi:hypothetical protein
MERRTATKKDNAVPDSFLGERLLGEGGLAPSRDLYYRTSSRSSTDCSSDCRRNRPIQSKNSRADLATALLDFYALAGGNVRAAARLPRESLRRQ